jgi:pantothenate kinase
LNFIKFDNIQEMIEFVRKILETSKVSCICATGGGSVKFKEKLMNELKVDIVQEDEMESLITGLNFLIRQIASEVFTYDERREEPIIYLENTSSELFPYMLVNIGSGVSIIKVTSEDSYERISGTSLGG